ncbi:Putative beta-Fructufuranosidase [Savitreella phatthalungensis]
MKQDGDEDRLQWRPRMHIMPKRGWLNDPCGLAWDERREQYTVSFQWNPHSHVWGNMSWGHATSKDLIRWTVSDSPSIEPSNAQDVCGVFTGCIVPPIKEKNQLIAYYTSAQDFPIHWTREYKRGSEKLHRATSTDGARSWQRDERNPVLTGPPDGLDVRGWRDPFVSSWPAFDLHLGREVGTGMYGLLAGSIVDNGPAAFLYDVDDGWRFLRVVQAPRMWWSLSDKLPDFGANWEVTNFVSLSGLNALITGVEGGREPAGISTCRLEHRQMWIAIEEDTFKLSNHGGCLDWGLFYAGNLLTDSNGDHVLFGWVLERDLPEPRRGKQGWAGCLSIPRVLRLVEVSNIIPGLANPDDVDWMWLDKDMKLDTYTLRTLAAVPHENLERARRRSLDFMSPDSGSLVEVLARLKVEADAQTIGLRLHHSTSEYTDVVYDPARSELVIERSHAMAYSDIASEREVASHAVFARKDSADETLDLRLILDNSVLELFANGRTAITTRIYPAAGGRIERIDVTGLLVDGSVFELDIA